MNVEVKVEHKNVTYTSQDRICGKIIIYCPHTTTIPEITANLVGESTSSLTGAPGLLFSRKEEETHTIVHAEQNIVPYPQSIGSIKREPLRLGVGKHTFDFSLKIPRSPECCPCVPEYLIETKGKRTGGHDQWKSTDLPPSVNDLGKGVGVRYRIEVVVTTFRNMFKSTLKRSLPITVWPPEAVSPSSPPSNQTSTTARATVLGPGTPTSSMRHAQLGASSPSMSNTPAEILISASLPSDYQFSRRSKSGKGSREINIDLAVEIVRTCPYEVYLQSFQMLLVGYTDIYAGAATHGQMTFWTLQSLSNLGIKVFDGYAPEGEKRSIESSLWERVCLEDSVVPNFSTCNLQRRYEVEILMGWQCQSGPDVGRIFFVQLRTPVKITSGILSNRPLSEIGKSESNSEAHLPLDNESTDFGNNLDHCWSFGGSHMSYYPPSYEEAVQGSVNERIKEFDLDNRTSGDRYQ